MIRYEMTIHTLLLELSNFPRVLLGLNKIFDRFSFVAVTAKTITSKTLPHL